MVEWLMNNKKLVTGVISFVILLLNEVFNDPELAAAVSKYSAGLLALILGGSGVADMGKSSS